MTSDVQETWMFDLERFQRGEHHEMFQRLRAEDPVSWNENPYGQGFWSLTKHADVQVANRDPELFSSERGGVSLLDQEELAAKRGSSRGDGRGVMMLLMDPPKHTRYRLLVNKGFTPRMVGLLEQYLRHRSVSIVNNIIERGSCDFVVDLASELPLQAIAEIMGVPQEDRKLLFEWSNMLIGIDDPEYAHEDPDYASRSLYEYVNDLAVQRRSNPRDDVVTKLINAEINGDKLSELEFDMFMLLLTVAGNETTRNTTAWGMYALMQNPQAYKVMRENPECRKLAIEEILRYASPVYHFRRTATQDVEIRGQQIKAGDKVVLWYISANRDEEVFDRPFEFDISRSPNEHVAFGGGGPHFCLGANLARMELRLIFDEILDRISDMRLTQEPQFLRSNFIGGIKHMPVAYTPGPQRTPPTPPIL
jgi:cholest-4-en-3-one 26-monooxygenase